MIILVGGEKGGVGKSTIATNLAVCFALQGRDVMLLDADEQCTAARWADRRNAAVGLPVVHSTQKTGDISHTARDLSARYGVVIIDAGGHDTREMRTGMVAADIMIIPTQASQPDLETMPHVDELISLARGMNPNLLAAAVLSIAPTTPQGREVAGAREFFSDFTNFSVADTVIRNRIAFRTAMLQGRGVMEMGDKKARAEIEALLDEIQESARV